ncbi:MAG: glycosyl hydrolase family 8 [Gammaproteobacteria bacterium]|nr:glycosyl hydrolase family 8 [Gammaproteobacteria bacterium]
MKMKKVIRNGVLMSALGLSMGSVYAANCASGYGWIGIENQNYPSFIVQQQLQVNGQNAFVSIPFYVEQNDPNTLGWSQSVNQNTWIDLCVQTASGAGVYEILGVSGAVPTPAVPTSISAVTSTPITMMAYGAKNTPGQFNNTTPSMQSIFQYTVNNQLQLPTPPLSSSYDHWKTDVLIQSGSNESMPGDTARVQQEAYMLTGSPGNNYDWFQHLNDTTSEGMGYGMLIAVGMNDSATFSDLYSYVQHYSQYYTEDASQPLSPKEQDGLMRWVVSYDNIDGLQAGAVPLSQQYPNGGSASDADIDIAYALLLAGDKWNNATYTDAALAMIKTIIQKDTTTSVNVSGQMLSVPLTLTMGDNNQTRNQFSLSYFKPAALTAFIAALNQSGDTVDAKAYQTLLSNSLAQAQAMEQSENGVIPGWSHFDANGLFQAGVDMQVIIPARNSTGAITDSTAPYVENLPAVNNIQYEYNGARTPMLLAWYVHNEGNQCQANASCAEAQTILNTLTASMGNLYMTAGDMTSLYGPQFVGQSYTINATGYTNWTLAGAVQNVTNSFADPVNDDLGAWSSTGIFATPLLDGESAGSDTAAAADFAHYMANFATMTYGNADNQNYFGESLYLLSQLYVLNSAQP